MKTVTVLDGQTLIDIAVQELGDPERAIEIAVLNGLSVTEEPAAGSTLLVSDYEKDKRNIVQLFTDTSNAPASTEKDEDVLSAKEGIGYWKIGNDFKVS